VKVPGFFRGLWCSSSLPMWVSIIIVPMKTSFCMIQMLMHMCAIVLCFVSLCLLLYNICSRYETL
jgi:hypothetical protein